MVGEQNMADLRAGRTSTEPPFTYVGLDMFGSFTVKHYRKEMKRYGIIFTCLEVVLKGKQTHSFKH